MKATASKTISVPIDKAWDVLSHHEGMESWAPGVKVQMQEVGSPEANGVGAVRRASLPGPAPAIVERITRFDAPNVLGYEALAGVPWKNHRGEVRLTEVAGGTKVEWELNGDGPVAVAALKPLAAILVGGFARAATRS